ncbi:MAG: tRNA lysidine(34) synthetase TilS [Armatimonadetes bacterium]|nr:tRNA lysidine(34) synthetase TilS [Armatimonadota bacterium]MDE2206270.1 tRNA lysidine(34) synthetase TilS [Armatimonadota bacterium]
MAKPVSAPQACSDPFEELVVGARVVLAGSGVAAGQRLLVGVSGGADSSALLCVLARIAEEDGLLLTAAHLDHGLRANAHEDASCAEMMCRRLGVPLVSNREDVDAIRHRARCSIEEAARLARHRFLRRAATDSGAALIAVGHTRDDVVETVLLNLLRGSGLRGIAAMRALDPPIIRPLIAATHRMTIACCIQAKLAWREDESNQDIRFTRNWLRHAVLPMLREHLGDAVDGNIARFGAIAGSEEAAMEERATSEFAAMASEEDDGCVGLPAERLAGLSDAVARRVVRRAIAAVRGNLDDVTFADVQRALAIARGERPAAELSWCDGASQMIVLRRGHLCVTPVSAPLKHVPWQAELGIGRSLHVPAIGLDVTLLPRGGSALPDGALLTVPVPAWASAPMSVELWRSGDRIGDSSGGSGSKVADLLTRAGLKGAARRKAVVMRANDGRCAIVIWLGAHEEPAAMSAPGDAGDLHLVVRLPLDRPGNNRTTGPTRSRVL